MDKEREKLIGKRLRAFRELCQIPRTAFATRIGFGNERIASYEAGRTPIPYRVFKAIADKYKINALWLAGESDDPRDFESYSDIDFIDKISDRSLFSEVYGRYLAPQLAEKRWAKSKLLSSKMEELHQLRSRTEKVFNKEAISKMQQLEDSLRELAKEYQWQLNQRADAKLKLEEVFGKDNLTTTTTSDKSVDVKPTLPRLLDRLNLATKESGKMSELAKHLGVPLASVSRWLAGKREPGGEVTLQMLQWVEQQEHQK